MSAPEQTPAEIRRADEAARAAKVSSDDSAAGWAVRWVPENPYPLCHDFTPQAPPSAFWCRNCHWNEPMHADEAARVAIADVLGQQAGEAAS